MGNCLGSEEAEVVEAVKTPGHHGHGQPRAAAAAATRSPAAMAAPPSPQVAAAGSTHARRSSPAGSSSMSSSFTTTASNSGSASAAGVGAEPDSGTILEAPNLRVFTFAELKAATRNFRPDTLLGEGGFGQVYKGWVDERTMNPARSGTGMVVAVKKLNQESVQGLQEWQIGDVEPPWRTRPLRPRGWAGRRRRSIGAKKRAALRWCNRDESPPPSLRAYAPAWFRRPRRAIAEGEGSSRAAPPSPASSAASSAVAPNSGLIFARNDEEERAAVAAAIRVSEAALA